MKSLIQNRPVTVFMVATMILTYPIGIAALIGLQPIQDMMPDWVRDDLITGSTSRFAPTIVALLLMAIAYGPSAFASWLTQLVRVNVSWKYYLGMFSLITLSWAVASFAVVEASGRSMEEVFASDFASTGLTVLDRVADYGREIVYITLTNGEETGWRFFMTAVLLVSFRPLPAALVTWVLWSVWHWPIILLGGSGIDLIVTFTLLLLPVSILATWIYIRTKSLFIVLLAHGIFNATTEYAFERQFPMIAEIVSADEANAAFYFAIPFALVALAVTLVDRRTMFSGGRFEELTSWARVKPEADHAS